MSLYRINEIGGDGYAQIEIINERHQTEMPLKSLRILYESGSILLVNPEEIYN